jgi:hypothetical protein
MRTINYITDDDEDDFFPAIIYIYEAKLWSLIDTAIYRILEADRAALDTGGMYRNWYFAMD